MRNGQMGSDPLNGNDAKAILGIIFDWYDTTEGPIPADLVEKLWEHGYARVVEDDPGAKDGSAGS